MTKLCPSPTVKPRNKYISTREKVNILNYTNTTLLCEVFFTVLQPISRLVCNCKKNGRGKSPDDTKSFSHKKWKKIHVTKFLVSLSLFRHSTCSHVLILISSLDLIKVINTAVLISRDPRMPYPRGKSQKIGLCFDVCYIL